MPTILVVDDSMLDQKIAAGCVEAAGCNVVLASNGREALEVVDRKQPDAVLTDLQMPEIDGLALVRHFTEHHPNMPVILMTAHGSEQIAVQALQAGAASYVPKKTLNRDLEQALKVVFSVAEKAEQRDQIRDLLEDSTSRFVLGYEPDAPRALISYLQDGLKRLNFCNESTLLRISTALTEALANAIDHGNLELDSRLRDNHDNSYRELGLERSRQAPYCDRRVRVTATLTPGSATFVIRDEGPGFNPDTLPDPTDPANLVKPSGRGILLMRMFLDEIRFNSQGNEVTLIKNRAE